jgi:hypothetical protein
MKKNLLLFYCLIVLSSLTFSTDSQAIMKRVTLSYLTNKASYICYGQVADVKSEWNENKTSISTTVNLSVLESLKNKASVPLSLTVPGGTVGEVTQSNSNSPLFWPNERVVVFIDSRSRLVGAFQGKFQVLNDLVVERGLPLTSFLAEIKGVQSGRDEGNFSPRSDEDNGNSSYCGYSVSPYRWCQDNPMGEDFYINTGATENQRSAIVGAALAWNSSGACFQFSYGGTSQVSGTTFDGTNIIYWDNQLDEQTLAQTTYWFNTTTGCMLEADCGFNENMIWNTTGEGSDYDIQTCMLHEFGHYLSLDHSKNSDAIMYPYYSSVRRSLSDDDITGITAIYGKCGDGGTPTWNAAYQLSVGSSENLALLREYRDQVLSRHPTGKYQIDCLYSHSKELLKILASNPKIILQAQQIIETNLPEIQKAVTHQGAVLQDPNDIFNFLGSLASCGSLRTKIWLNGLKGELKRCQKTGQKFYGFKVSK